MHPQFIKKVRKQTTRRSNQGFSLPSLLVGSVVSLLAIATGGYGIAQMLNVSTSANATSERRIELDRALTFLEDETRAAESIIQNASSSAIIPTEFNPEAATGVTDAQRVLILNTAGVAQPIIYYLAEPADNTWSGPKMIYRWGPDFDNSGAYTNASSPSDWSYQPLIDKIADSGTPQACPTGWTGNGSAGFYVCVDAAGKMAQVQQAGRINKVLGKTDTYTTSSQMAVRASEVVPTAFVPPAGASFSENDGTITTGATSTIRIEILGGAITCGADGPNIPTRATLNLHHGNTTNSETISSAMAVYTQNNVPAGTKVDITGISEGDINSGDCNGQSLAANSASNSSLVLALQDGDTVPNFIPFDNQPSLDSYLSSIIDANGEVDLPSNEVVFIYELGTEDQSDPAFDAQDLVVRATITPTVN